MSKVLFICLIAFPISTNCFGQKFSVDELIRLYENNNNYFDTYVVEKGFNFYKHKNNLTVYSYKNDTTINNSISFGFPPDEVDSVNKSRFISWVFTSDSTYVALKKDILDRGFESYSTDKDQDDNKRQFSFKRGKYFISLDS